MTKKGVPVRHGHSIAYCKDAQDAANYVQMIQNYDSSAEDGTSGYSSHDVDFPEPAALAREPVGMLYLAAEAVAILGSKTMAKPSYVKRIYIYIYIYCSLAQIYHCITILALSITIEQHAMISCV